jgi:hypothetical protein
MDPYSAEGELINIHNHFHQGQYQEVVDFDTASLSPENALPARVLQLRARIALGQSNEVLDQVKADKSSSPDLQAAAALAQLKLGNTEEAVAMVEKLAQNSGENAAVQVVGGTVLQAAGKTEEALSLLAQHQGSCTLPLLPKTRGRFADGKLLHSGRSGTDCADPSTTEQERPGVEGGDCCTKMGARQPLGQPCRVLGWLETSRRSWMPRTTPFTSRMSLTPMHRGARGTSRPSMSLKSLHRRLQHPQHAVLWRRRLLSYISVGRKRRRQRWNKLWRKSPIMPRQSPTCLS